MPGLSRLPGTRMASAATWQSSAAEKASKATARMAEAAVLVQATKNDPNPNPASRAARANTLRSSETASNTKKLSEKLSEKSETPPPKVIQAFVDTSVSPVGTIALKKLFQLADMDHNGSIDRDELGAALRKLGFSHLSTKQIDQILNRADKDDNFEIDYDEFVREAPKTLKTNLVKLAKDNGSALGFLA